MKLDCEVPPFLKALQHVSPDQTRLSMTKIGLTFSFHASNALSSASPKENNKSKFCGVVNARVVGRYFGKGFNV
jgi:hypothetical protein